MFSSSSQRKEKHFVIQHRNLSLAWEPPSLSLPVILFWLLCSCSLCNQKEFGFHNTAFGELKILSQEFPYRFTFLIFDTDCLIEVTRGERLTLAHGFKRYNSSPQERHGGGCGGGNRHLEFFTSWEQIKTLRGVPEVKEGITSRGPLLVAYIHQLGPMTSSSIILQKKATSWALWVLAFGSISYSNHNPLHFCCYPDMN